ncbi:response regulator transcription factor [Vibrio aquaticus]|uniref:Response regulator transcription factor n=1 Tax=Vibrio aquaticus TaxID=2496559 RepID=A0A3S0PQT5_9VIBR|nr:response regulator transcription factor [Vibrio aquaticus]RTZ17525.1 response regulator transcription factor [Vibrio aquaticus]
MPLRKHTQVTTRCLIYDDHPIVCESLKVYIKRLDFIDTVESVSTYKEALEMIKSGHFNLLLLDINLEEADGFEFFRRIQAHGYSGRTLFLSSYTQAYCVRTAFELGADGYIAKSESTDVIVKAISDITRGFSYFKYGEHMQSGSENRSLSSRETVVLNYLMEGRCNKDIAEMLGLSAKTISTYKARILKKHGVRSVIEIINKNDTHNPPT